MTPTPVRFNEFERYDITKDADVIRLMAVTPKGTYSAEIVKDGARKLREVRSQFREKAIDLITSGADPCEVEL